MPRDMHTNEVRKGIVRKQGTETVQRNPHG
jgi:hypothetical protein